jgi:GT2 family glycosyltransferase
MKKNARGPPEIIIVDDGSVDDSVDWLLRQGFVDITASDKDSTHPAQSCINSASKSQIETKNVSVNESSPPCLKLIRNELNRGFGPACNRGFEAALHPLVFLLNNDVEVDPRAIPPLVENFTDDSVFAVHSRVFDLESRQECGSGKDRKLRERLCSCSPKLCAHQTALFNRRNRNSATKPRLFNVCEWRFSNV